MVGNFPGNYFLDRIQPEPVPPCYLCRSLLFMRSIESISGTIVDPLKRELYRGTVNITDGRISSVVRDDNTQPGFIMPGFTDAHIHIESSMLVPYEFARAALRHGTVATVSDPHEIANVLGIAGVDYMIDNARDAVLKFNFGAPSCVPATTFETAGDALTPAQVDDLLKRSEIRYLSEMMNYPGVLNNDPDVMAKIASAKKYAKPVDGHAPGLTGNAAAKYIASGISTDHECFTLEEALGKIAHGMKILIREGSAARNFDALHTLIGMYPDLCMFCCDDKHPDELLLSHINDHVRRAMALGYDLFDVLKIASVNPVLHYKLPVGLLQPGDCADLIVCNNLSDFTVDKTVVNGNVVFENGTCTLPQRSHKVINKFHAEAKTIDDIIVIRTGNNLRVIEAIDGQLITKEFSVQLNDAENEIVSDVKNDILKIVVVNRYADEKPAVAFIKNFGFKHGAIASSVAHDSHNVIAVGADDESLLKAINLVIKHKGGLAAVDGETEKIIALPVAGLMSDQDCEYTGNAYAELSAVSKRMGSQLRSPFMTLSFMALLVIPQLKLSDKGLFDGEKFEFVDSMF